MLSSSLAGATHRVGPQRDHRRRERQDRDRRIRVRGAGGRGDRGPYVVGLRLRDVDLQHGRVQAGPDARGDVRKQRGLARVRRAQQRDLLTATFGLHATAANVPPVSGSVPIAIGLRIDAGTGVYAAYCEALSSSGCSTGCAHGSPLRIMITIRSAYLSSARASTRPFGTTGVEHASQGRVVAPVGQLPGQPLGHGPAVDLRGELPRAVRVDDPRQAGVVRRRAVEETPAQAYQARQGPPLGPLHLPGGRLVAAAAGTQDRGMPRSHQHPPTVPAR